MSHNRDPLGYYAVLGVNPSASTAKIKKAFKAKARELHPDRNSAANATRQFQLLHEAYQVLGDAHSRSEYDATAYAFSTGADHPEQDQISVRPVACSVCGRISIQPRYAIYRYVASFFLVTYRGADQGVFCARCSARRAYKNSLITWIFGWWAIPWGPIYSIQAIVRNMLGGEQPSLTNFRIVAIQAAHFASNARMDLARLLSDQALQFSRIVPAFESDRESAADRDLKNLLLRIKDATPEPTRTLKPVWGTRSFAFRIQAFAAFFVAVALLTLLVLNVRSNRTAYRQAALRGDIFDRVQPNGAESVTSEALRGVEHSAPDVPASQPPIASTGDRNAFNEPMYALPTTGRMHIARRRAHDITAPLKILSFSGSSNYYVKLIDWTTHTPVVFFFIRSGEILSGEVPLGEYELHYAAGNKWYGEEYLFGRETVYSRADAHFVFDRETGKIAGYTIQLRKQIGGNLKEIPLKPSEF